MTKKLRIWTARVDYTGMENEVVLNTTAKSAKGLGKVFAPTWEMVMARRHDEITWEQYTERYLNLLRDRYRKNQPRFREACEAEELVLLCYCRNSVSNGKQCHRYILADVLVKVANSFEIEAQYMGERLEYTNRPQNPK